MNKPFLSYLLLASLSAGASAQSLPPGRTEETYVMADDRILGTLELDTTQRRQLGSIERRYQQDMRALNANDTLSGSAAKAEADRLTGARHREMKSVLSPDQYARWARMIADHEVP
jgi:hypothetical protein